MEEYNCTASKCEARSSYREFSIGPFIMARDFFSWHFKQTDSITRVIYYFQKRIIFHLEVLDEFQSFTLVYVWILGFENRLVSSSFCINTTIKIDKPEQGTETWCFRIKYTCMYRNIHL